MLGFPSTNNTRGYSHVKILDGVLTCSSKLKTLTAGHSSRGGDLHAIFTISTQSSALEAIAKRKPAALLLSLIHFPSVLHELHHHSVSNPWNLTRAGSSHKVSFPMQALLKAIDDRNAGAWPSVLYATATACGLWEIK